MFLYKARQVETSARAYAVAYIRIRRLGEWQVQEERDLHHLI